MVNPPRTKVAFLLVVGLSLGVAGCGLGRSDAFPDRVAKVTVDGRTVTYQLDSCGLDGETAFLVGRSESGSVLQAVVGVEADGETGVPESSGISVYHFESSPEPSGALAAFGDEAWERRGRAGEAPGGVTSARVRGARIQAEGVAMEVDDDEVPTGPQELDLRLDARCDA